MVDYPYPMNKIQNLPVELINHIASVIPRGETLIELILAFRSSRNFIDLLPVLDLVEQCNMSPFHVWPVLILDNQVNESNSPWIAAASHLYTEIEIKFDDQKIEHIKRSITSKRPAIELIICKYLDLDEFIALSDVIRIMNVTQLEFFMPTDDIEFIDPTSINTIASVLKGSRLRNLSFSFQTYLSSEDYISLAKGLAHSRLELLQFISSSMEDDDFVSVMRLLKHTKVKRFECVGNYITGDAIDQIISGDLLRTCGLESINLLRNPIDAEHIAIMAHECKRFGIGLEIERRSDSDTESIEQQNEDDDTI